MQVQRILNSRLRIAGVSIPILGTTITLERLAKRGYESMLDYYSKIFAEQSKEELTPLLSNRPARDPNAGWCERRTLSRKLGRAIYSIIASAS